MRNESPLARYHADLQQDGFIQDPAQQAAVECLHAIHQQLAGSSGRSRFLPRLSRSTAWRPVQGAYLWGGVGRGKTYLMDCFYETLPTRHKRRLHFHRFMQDVHQHLKRLGSVSDPLKTLAEELARDTRVLCFDEFFVSDVADAMILGRLLDKLFAQGVTLIATSNIPPDQLYQNGLQRERFLPAIAALQSHCQIVTVNGDQDYRLRLLEQAEIYHWPDDAAAAAQLDRAFRQIAPDAAHPERSLNINGREIPVRKQADGIAWFDFSALCQGPRSVDDYIEIARLFGTVILSGVPQLDRETENEARRFLHLIDEFYDRRVKLMISAEVDMTSLYVGAKLRFEYARVASRLQEMQSHDYLALAHIP